MRFLADENFPKPVIDRLAEEGHEVSWAGTDFPSTEDKWLLDRAETEGRILLTLDRDFWHLAIQRKVRLSNAGVILFRVHPATPKRVEALVFWALALEDRWIGRVALVTPEGIDLAPAGRQ
jgi:predicted nuclease of predicted toxin-antitoxin system